MAISKVIYGGRTLLDLTNDTVATNNLLTGYVAHGPDGELVEGACSYDSDTKDATAAASEILSGKTAYVNGEKRTGVMTNNGGVEGLISAKDESYTIPQGFHDGSGKVKIAPNEVDKLIPENIRKGINLLGIQGSMSGTEGAVPQAKTVTPSTTEQIIHPDSDDGYNFLSQVTVLAIPYKETANTSGGLTVTIA